MRYVLIGLALVTLLALMITGGDAPPQAVAAQDCTKNGTQNDDILAGGSGRDVICGKDGKDYEAGGGGPDILRGGKGPDTLVGGAGSDAAYGKKGGDRLFLVDHHAGGYADGGPGHDRCYVDRGDRVNACEEVFRGKHAATEQALTVSFHGGLEEAEEQITALETSPPPATVTQTITITVTAPPQCASPPASPPPGC